MNQKMPTGEVFDNGEALRVSLPRANKSNTISTQTHAVMKSAFSVQLGAIAGAIGLPVMMWISWLLPTIFFPNLFDVPLNSGKTTLTSSDVAMCFIVGAMLGLSSVMLYRDRHHLGPRIISTGSALCVGLFLIYIAKRDSSSTEPEILSESAFFFPMLLWSLTLFFFTVLVRRKPLLP